MNTFTKLSIQIGVLSLSMIALSFLTESDIWYEYFNYIHQSGAKNGFCQNMKPHYHWNYRGWVYFITGLIYFIISVVRIILSHDKKFIEKNF